MRRVLCFCLAVALGQCDDTAPDPLKRTPPGTGATVVWDLLARPLPDIPFPNDVATFADPTSRTGRRVNASLVATTSMERVARSVLAEMEGWGTFAPMWVRFTKPPGAAPLDPALDLEDVRSRMQGDDYAFADDPIYVVNLKTGVPAVLDVGAGAFPLVLKNPDRYWPNDPHVASDTLLYEDREEAAGVSDYDPALDTDFDGVLDHPNTLGPGGQHPGIDNLLTWYERETDSLVIRPLIPLDEKTEYAVVITDRLHGSDGKPVRSPFPGVYHPLQRDAITRLRAALKGDDPKFKNYYGDIAGTGLEHVAFAWTFTTAPMIEDMILLRDGLYGKGPFSRFATEFPAKLKAVRAAGTEQGDVQPKDWDKSNATCTTRSKTPYVVRPNDPDIRQTFQLLYREVFGYDAGDIKALDEANTFVDHVVVGSYESPFLQGDPTGQDPDARFHVNFKTGEGDVHRDSPSFWLAVPKPTKTQKQPFPIALFGHGVGGNGTESLAHGGNYARNGVATVTINMPMHGFPNAPEYVGIARGELTNRCLVPWVDALFLGRTHDYNGDGQTDPGWWWWTSHLANDRDNVRQGTLDEMQFTRILRTFDGKTMSGQDYDGDGNPDLAGDFDGDGTVDVAGPNVPIYTAGESLGGIMSDIHGGIDHQIAASAPMSGGGGLMHDVGMRSYGVTESLAQTMSPLFVSFPATERTPDKHGLRSNCHLAFDGSKDNGACSESATCPGSQVCSGGRCFDADPAKSDRSVRMLVEDGDDVPEIELACLRPDEDSLGMTAVLTNLISGERRCARTTLNGLFRVPIPASIGDRLELTMYNAPDAVTDYASCNLKPDAPLGRRINRFEQKAPRYNLVAEGNPGCPDGQECAQFLGNWFPVGSPLVAVQNGLGYMRNTPLFRRFAAIGQMIFDPGDPVNFAPYYFLKTLPTPDGTPTPPRGLMNINTVGDGFVSISTGISFARAAGVVPFFPPQALNLYPEYKQYVTPPELYALYSRKTPLRVLIETHLVEGIARLQRHPAGPACGVNYRLDDPVTCPRVPAVNFQTCLATLYDVDWFGEGKQPYDQQHLTSPLRLARRADTPITDEASLRKAWEPRITGNPLSTDDTGAWKADVRVLALTNVYLEPEGKHTWETGDACKLWDAATYGGNLTGHFFASGGKDPYYLSHPATHGCLETKTCDFYK